MATSTDHAQRAVEKALDSAVESWKQQITFAGVLLALSLTFSKDFVPRAHLPALGLTVAAWAALLASIITGLLAFGRLAADLSAPGTVVTREVIWTSRQFALTQFLLLVVGVALMAGAVGWSLLTP
jgi:hypothetical protein